MAQELKELSSRHLCMVEAVLNGASNGDIARAFCLTDSTVSLIIRTPLFQDALAQRRTRQQGVVDQALASTVVHSRGILENAAAQAAKTHVDLLDSLDPKVRQVSATEILKRTYDNKFMIGTNGQPTVNINLTPEGLLNLQTALAESKRLHEKKPDLIEQADLQAQPA